MALRQRRQARTPPRSAQSPDTSERTSLVRSSEIFVHLFSYTYGVESSSRTETVRFEGSRGLGSGNAAPRCIGRRHGSGSEATPRPRDRPTAISTVIGDPHRHEPRAVVVASRAPPPEAHDLLAATCGKFTEGFGTSDLVSARSLTADLESDRPRREIPSARGAIGRSDAFPRPLSGQSSPWTARSGPSQPVHQRGVGFR